MMQRRQLLHLFGLAAGTVLGTHQLSGCGFKLRQPYQFAFKSIYLGEATANTIKLELLRTLRANSSLTVITQPSERSHAQVVLEVIEDSRVKRVVGVTATGVVREFQLQLKFKYRLRTIDDRDLIEEAVANQTRDISFNDGVLLAKENEEQLIYRDMQIESVQQIMRRLASVKSIATPAT